LTNRPDIRRSTMCAVVWWLTSDRG
jgi:hypothetical protein